MMYKYKLPECHLVIICFLLFLKQNVHKQIFLGDNMHQNKQFLLSKLGLQSTLFSQKLNSYYLITSQARIFWYNNDNGDIIKNFQQVCFVFSET